LVTYSKNLNHTRKVAIHSSIYIKKKVCLFVCLFVRYAFEHGTSKCNEILQGIPFRPGEGRRIIFDPKFPSQGGLCPSYCWIYYSKCLFQRICAYDRFLNNSRTKVYKNLRFLPLGTRHFRILEKKTNRMYKMKKNRMNENIHRMKKVTSEMKFHCS
jgi:hypothetical protein